MRLLGQFKTLFFLYKIILHTQKAQRSTKSTKSTKTQPSKRTKRQ